MGGLSVHVIHQEFWTMTIEERERLAEVVLEEVAGRAPVVVGVSDNASRNVIRLARHARSAGATAVMIRPPCCRPRDAQGVRAFYEECAAKCVAVLRNAGLLPDGRLHPPVR